MDQILNPRLAVNIASILRDARLKVCEAFYQGGPDAALACLASQSVRLARHVEDGDLLWSVAFRNLLQVACNLKLPLHCGRREVRRAIKWGPLFFDMSEAA